MQWCRVLLLLFYFFFFFSSADIARGLYTIPFLLVTESAVAGMR